MLRFLQNYSHTLEVVYDAIYRLLHPFRRWLKPNTLVERIMI